MPWSRRVSGLRKSTSPADAVTLGESLRAGCRHSRSVLLETDSEHTRAVHDRAPSYPLTLHRIRA
eukprot:2403793-Rhodomonas_salina.3